MKTQKWIPALLLGLGLSAAPRAFADGFVCASPTDNLEVRVFNRTQPDEGTRNVAVMVISDPTRPRGDRTLARFESGRDELKNEGTVFTVQVNPQPFAVEKSILGLRLAQIQDIVLRVDFSYQSPVEDGSLVHGVLELYALNGDQLWVDVDCKRYLKGRSI